ncbi:hypothetical protein ACWN8N_11595, partial [Tetragenococcus halophilus subsp. halophilus]
LQLPSDSTSQWTPLLLANSSYCQACSGLSPPSYRPCRAHQKNPVSRLLTGKELKMKKCLLGLFRWYIYNVTKKYE